MADALGGFDPSTVTPDTTHEDPLDEQVQRASSMEGVPFDIARRLVQTESSDNPNALNHDSGAIGYTQLLPSTAKMLGVNPHVPTENLAGGFRYLKQLYGQFGSWTDALAAYNWGPGNLQTWIDNGRNIAHMPAETRAYVAKIGGHKHLQMLGERARGFDPSSVKPSSEFDPATVMTHPVPSPTPKPSAPIIPAQPDNPWRQRAQQAFSVLAKPFQVFGQMQSQALHGAEAGARGIVQHVLDPAADVFTEVGGGLERGVGGYIRDVTAHPEDNPLFMQPGAAEIGQHIGTDPKRLVGSIWHDVIHADAQSADTTAERNFVHLPTPQAVNTFVNAHVPQPLRPYVAGTLNTAANVGVNMAFDPLTYIGLGPAIKGGRMLLDLGHVLAGSKAGLRAVQVGDSMFQLAQKYHIAPSTPWLKNFASDYGKMTQAYAKWFHVRPDLDWMGPRAKAMRIQLENQTDALTNRLRVGESDVQTADQARAKYLNLLWEHGSDSASAAAYKATHADLGVNPLRNPHSTQALTQAGNPKVVLQQFEDMSPKERAAYLNRLADNVNRNLTATASEQFFKEHPELLAGKDVPDWKKVLTRGQTMGRGDKLDIGRLSVSDTNWFRRLVQAALFSNPLPHMVNISTLAFLAGGLHTVPEALKYMGMASARGTSNVLAKLFDEPDEFGRLHATETSTALRNFGTKIDPAQSQAFVKDVQRLQAGGSLPDYTRGMKQSPIFSKLPGWQGWVLPMQRGLNDVETGWRVSLLRKLDRQLGPSKTAEDEAWKMHLIDQYVGDYNNQTAFVNLFKAFGGPWVAFHLGIVPKAVAGSIASDPARALALARTQDQLQQNRTPRAQTQNQLVLPGTPLHFLTQPAHYALSDSSFGLLNIPQEVQRDLDEFDVPHAAMRFGHDHFLPSGFEMITHAIQGRAMPGPSTHGIRSYQPQTLTDRLAGATIEALGGYYQAKMSAKAQQAIAREERAKARARQNRSKASLVDTLLTGE